MRKIFEALGANVTWDSNTETVTAQKSDISLQLKIG
ncbi:stalk domain-containing protein [Paenibacillus sp. HGH0039]